MDNNDHHRHLQFQAQFHQPQYSFILSLPNEVLETIILRLTHPVDAICLSLTCRTFYYGILSAQNRFLWYRIGDFENHLPGYSSQWKLETREWREYLARNPERKSLKEGMEGVAGVEGERSQQGELPPYLTSPLQDVASTTNILWDGSTLDANQIRRNFDSKQKNALTRQKAKWLHSVVKKFSSQEAGIDYRRMLAETMIGKTKSGCQLCLKEPTTVNSHHRPFVGKVIMKICDRCWEAVWHGNRQREDDQKFKWLLGYQVSFLNIDHSLVPTCIPYALTRKAEQYKFVWRPTVERLYRAASGPRSHSLDFVISKEPLAPHLSEAYNALFDAVKGAYTTYCGDGMVEIRRMIHPELLRFEWFFQPLPQGTRWNDFRRWMKFSRKATLLQELLLDRSVWEEKDKVQRFVTIKLIQMQEFIGSCCSPLDLEVRRRHEWDIPRHSLRTGILENVRLWHTCEVSMGGAHLLLRRMNQSNGGTGFECPWECGMWELGILELKPKQCSRVLTSSSTIEEIILHIAQIHCRSFLLRGDLDWMIGKPSRWWPENLIDKMACETCVFSDRVCYEPGCSREPVVYKAAEEQEAWLRKWWPDRWKDEYTKILQQWEKEGAFHGGGCITKIQKKNGRMWRRPGSFRQRPV